MRSPDDPADGAAAPGAPVPPAPSSRLTDELAQLWRAFKRLTGAQIELLRAELGLARSAFVWMLVAGLAATVTGVGLGLTLLGLIGVLLARWFGSWPWALAALAGLQLLCLVVAMWGFRRCMHWLTLPRSRRSWRELLGRAQRQSASQTPPSDAPPVA